GERILQIRADDSLETQRKADGTPVTRADHASQETILAGLAILTPDIPVIAEEQDHKTCVDYPTYWLVDPLDGTRDFITGRNDFSVNIGLIRDGVPVAGLVYAPARDDLVFGAIGEEGFRRLQGTQTPLAPPPTRQPPRLTISVRDSHKAPLDEWQRQGRIENYAIHASAYKMTLVAVGEADLFLRLSVTSEWDTAAGHAILNAMGGRVITPDGHDLAYGKKERRNGCLAAMRGDAEICLADQFWPGSVSGSTSNCT
ncbi:MAG: 3'(2'),5'-bisphosphate nucleotidase CysQ, partial [Bdellovibrionales bacterium]